MDHKIKGQNWQGALSHIDRKSVDIVLCDKNYIAPKLVIELDDKSHERLTCQYCELKIMAVQPGGIGLEILREFSVINLKTQNMYRMCLGF